MFCAALKVAYGATNTETRTSRFPKARGHTGSWVTRSGRKIEQGCTHFSRTCRELWIQPLVGASRHEACIACCGPCIDGSVACRRPAPSKSRQEARGCGHSECCKRSTPARDLVASMAHMAASSASTGGKRSARRCRGKGSASTWGYDQWRAPTAWRRRFIPFTTGHDCGEVLESRRARERTGFDILIFYRMGFGFRLVRSFLFCLRMRPYT